MTETQQFIEDAIKGGWHKDQKFRLAAGYIKFTTTDADGFLEKIPVAEALLNPFVWQAVGKTRGWEDEIYIVQAHLFMTGIMAQSKSIEDALLAIK